MINAKDYASIEAALLEARALGVPLYFPSGEYLTDGLVVEHGDVLIGDGREKTVIKCVAGLRYSPLDVRYACCRPIHERYAATYKPIPGSKRYACNVL